MDVVLCHACESASVYFLMLKWNVMECRSAVCAFHAGHYVRDYCSGDSINSDGVRALLSAHSARRHRLVVGFVCLSDDELHIYYILGESHYERAYIEIVRVDQCSAIASEMRLNN